MLLPIWQRNGRYAVGVPVQYCDGLPVAEQFTVYGVPEKIEPLPLMCQPSKIAFPTGWFNKCRLTPGMS
jgi:hypothetical protein